MRKRLWWIVAGLIVVGAPIAWYLGSPLFISRTVVEEFPLSSPGVLPEGISQREAEDTMSKAAQEEHTMDESMPSAGPAVVRSRGMFVGADSFHQGSGDALLVEVGGTIVVRLENFRVTNGPDLYVYLSSHPNPRTREQVHEGTVNLGRLKGNIGAQNYALPAGIDLSAVRSVVIYCQRFHVLFAMAPLQSAP
ncbi:MAG TPA: DM13 domain-containing protein [bacterium]|jgi:hypothetical protein|nr:DM13 domain-containing protein [bacterium]